MRRGGIFAVCLCCIILISACKSSESIRIVQNTSELIIGLHSMASTRFSVVPAGSGKLEWQTSDTSVVTVTQDGVVSAVGGGRAIISVYDEETGGRDSCTVWVYVMPEGITVSVDAVTLKVKGSKVLKTKLFPVSNVRKDDRAITWISSDPSVATVSAKGRIKALSPGEAIITAMTVNNLKAVCVVTVEG